MTKMPSQTKADKAQSPTSEPDQSGQNPMNQPDQSGQAAQQTQETGKETPTENQEDPSPNYLDDDPGSSDHLDQQIEAEKAQSIERDPDQVPMGKEAFFNMFKLGVLGGEQTRAYLFNDTPYQAILESFERSDARPASDQIYDTLLNSKAFSWIVRGPVADAGARAGAMAPVLTWVFGVGTDLQKERQERFAEAYQGANSHMIESPGHV